MQLMLDIAEFRFSDEIRYLKLRRLTAIKCHEVIEVHLVELRERFLCGVERRVGLREADHAVVKRLQFRVRRCRDRLRRKGVPEGIQSAARGERVRRGRRYRG